MALCVGQPVGRLRSASKGLTPDEQSSDTAALIQNLFLPNGSSYDDDLFHLGQTAGELRQNLFLKPSAKDVFRHAEGFEKVLEILRTLHPQRTSPEDSDRDLEFPFRAFFSLLDALNQLLLVAQRQHHGNERYFRNHLDGWKSLEIYFARLQLEMIEKCDEHYAVPVAQQLAIFYDNLLGLALGIEAFEELSLLDGPDVYLTRDPKLLRVSLEQPQSLSILIKLVIAFLSSAKTSEESVEVASRAIGVLLTFIKSSTRNAWAVWQSGVLSDVVAAAFDIKIPQPGKDRLLDLLLCLGQFGLSNLNDVASLFSRASEVDAAREHLLALLKSSKEPAYIQFDSFTHGFSAIEVPSLRWAFPSPIGYAFTAWMRIDEYDVQAHTTIFGAFDSSHTCFLLMYLEKDSHQLILQTSVRAPNPSVRFKSTCFKSGKWYHIALVQRRSDTDPSLSVASLYVDGNFAEQRKLPYPELPEDHRSDQHSGRRLRTVQAFFGTTQGVATDTTPETVRSRWSLASAHMYAVPLTDEFVAVHYRLGPRYRGNLQDCLGPLLTYRASSELNQYNETLHPDKTDSSDIVTATEGRGSDVVPESRLYLSICPYAVIDLDTNEQHSRNSAFELDRKAVARYQKLKQSTKAVAVNTAVASLNDAFSRSYGTGILIGDPIVVVPHAIDDASWCLSGSLPLLSRLLDSATTKTTFLQAVEVFFECVKDNWRISEAMEKGSGFGVLAVVIREKLGLEIGSSQTSTRKLSPPLSVEDRRETSRALLELILDFVGYNRESPEQSMLVNPMAYRVLLLDFDTWRRCDLDTQKLYYAQFVHFIKDNHNAAFNQKRLVRMRTVKRMIEVLKSEDVTEEAARLMMGAVRAMVGQSNTFQNTYRDIAMFIAWALHDQRALPPVRSFASTVSLRQKVGSWTKGARPSRPSTPGSQPTSQPRLGLSRAELGITVLRELAEILDTDTSGIAVRRFTRAVPNRWLLHLLAEQDVRVVELTLSIICKAMSSLGPDFKPTFAEKNGGFITLKARMKPFWRSPSIWSLALGIFFGRNVPLEWLPEDFSAFHLVELLGVDDTLTIANPEMLPSIFAMLEAGLRTIARAEAPVESNIKVMKNVIQFLSELYDRSTAFREFALNSRYLQELLFILYPLLAGTDRLSAETELQSEALSFQGEEVSMRPHSNSVGERPPSVRSLDVSSNRSGKRTPSPMSVNRVRAPSRISSFVLVNDRLAVPLAQFKAPMAPSSNTPVKINVTNSLVESLLELAIALIIDNVCYKDKFSGIGLFVKVPPGFKEHQAYFESYVLVHALSQLGNHLRLNQHLFTETRVLTNLARYAQHMAEAVSEGWFMNGAQPLLDFTGEILEHLQQSQIADVKSVRLCSQSTNAIRVVFLKATLWRLAELNEDSEERDVKDFLNKMSYWQTILFSAENQESNFTRLICYLLYHKLISGVHSVRLAAARLWRTVLVQKPTETATMLTNTMGPDQRHLSTGFMKLVSMDDDDFLEWVDNNRSTLDSVFQQSLSKPWDDFVQKENRDAEETTRNRLSKRRDKLRQWHMEETTADDFIHRYEVSTNHWRANVHAQERVKLQRAQQDHQENINNLMTAFTRIDKVMKQPCGLDPQSTTRWQLDDTEAANRMRMRVVPDTSDQRQAIEPRRKGSHRYPNGRLAIDTRLRSASDSTASPRAITPGSPLPFPLTDGAAENTAEGRPRSESISNSQLLEGGFEMVDDPKEDEDGLIEDKNRKVMTSLQRGDMVQQLYNISRIVGLEACEGLLVIGQKCLYMQDNFFQRSDGEIVSVSQAPEDERDPYVQLISGKDVGAQRTKHAVGDQETRHWMWAEVLSLSKRRFLLRDVSIEVFFSDGRSYLITCMSSKVRDDLYSAIVSRAPHVHSTSSVASEDAWRLDTLRNPEEVPRNLGSKLNSIFNNGPTHAATKRWQRGEMSNFQYLMLVNTMAGRTFNDLTQYPVFPWVLADYTSDELDLDNPKTFRDFSKPMGCQTPIREAEYKDRYKQFAEMGDQNAPAFHYGTHYSSAMIVSSYLIRLQPFVQSYLLLQGGSFDHADRLFDSIEKAWLSASKETMSDVRELTPEFFYLPEFLTNVNKYDFGTKQVSGELVNDVKLPKWAKGDPHIFVAKHREALESPYVSQNLPDWIDLIFGYKQRGEAAIEATNVFNHLSYAGAKDLDKIDDRVEHVATIGIIHSFGQTPHQVFQKQHPYRELDRVEPKLDTLAETLTRLPEPEMSLGEKVADFTYQHQVRSLASGSCRINVLPDCTRFMQWGFADNSIRFFSSHSKRIMGLYENTHIGPVTTAAFVDSKTLVTGGQDCTIGIWKVSASSKDLIEISPKTYLFGHRTSVSVLAVSRIFSTLLSISTDGQALLWGLNRFNCIRVLLPPGGPLIQTAKISNVSGHILLCHGARALLYTLNGHLLVSQSLCDDEDDDDEEDESILCCAFYEGAGNEFLERELIFTGHKNGVTKVWTLMSVGNGEWCLLLVKRLLPPSMMMLGGGGAGGGGGDSREGKRKGKGITAILPVARDVYTGDEEGEVWKWECVVRGGRGR